MTNEEFADLIAIGAEQAHVEFKAPGRRTDSQLFQKVIRAILAMTNRRDGGVVIVGVDDDRGSPILTGLSQEDATSWRADDVRDGVAPFADPSVDIEVSHLTHEEKRFVIIQVREFADVPVICRRDAVELNEGAIYVRSRRKPESVPIPRQAEMRDLIELATEKRLRAFLRTSTSVGLVPATPTEPTGNEQFASQESAFLADSHAVVQKAQSRGHWRLSIGPAQFEAQRVSNVMELFPMVDRSKVHSRGWIFPYTSDTGNIRVGTDWTEQDTDARVHVEAWRMHQSSLFVAVNALWEDWYEQDDLFAPPTGDAQQFGSILYAEYVVGVLTEFFEFAARLASSSEAGDAFRLRASIHGIQSRQLRFIGRRVPFRSHGLLE